RVVVGAAAQPVVAVVAEDAVLAVVNLVAGGVRGVEVEEEVGDLGQRVVGVVGGQLARGRVVAERVVGVGDRVAAVRVEGGADRQVVVPGGLGLAAADGVVAGAGVDEVVAG